MTNSHNNLEIWLGWWRQRNLCGLLCAALILLFEQTVHAEHLPPYQPDDPALNAKPEPHSYTKEATDAFVARLGELIQHGDLLDGLFLQQWLGQDLTFKPGYLSHIPYFEARSNNENPINFVYRIYVRDSETKYSDLADLSMYFDLSDVCVPLHGLDQFLDSPDLERVRNGMPSDIDRYMVYAHWESLKSRIVEIGVNSQSHCIVNANFGQDAVRLSSSASGGHP